MIAAPEKKDNNKNTAVAGDRISFTRKGVFYTGQVIAVYNNSVCVDILSYGTLEPNTERLERTIVSYKRYEIL